MNREGLKKLHYADYRATTKGQPMDEERRANIDQFLRELNFAPNGDFVYPLENIERIGDLIEGQLEWLKKKLKLNPEERRPKFNKIKFFKREEYKDLTGRNSDGANVFGTTETLMPLEDGEQDMFHRLGHELVHALSRHLIKVELTEDKNLVDFNGGLYGLENRANNAFHLFNEAVTEMINLEILTYLQETKGTISGKETGIGYPFAVIYFDLLFDKLAVTLNTDPNELRKKFYTAYFLGDASVYDLFRKAFPGSEAVKILARINEETDLGQVIRDNVFGIDITELQRINTRYNNGEEVVLKSGLKIKGKKSDAPLKKIEI